MKRILFTCNTAYQIIVAVQLRLTEFKEYKADIIITDIVKNHLKVCKNLEEACVFDNVINAEVKELDFISNKFLKLDFYFKKKIMSQNSKTMLLMKKNRYDIYLFANLGGFATRLGKYLTSTNKNMEYYMFEDGISSYSYIYGETLMRNFNDNSFIDKLKSVIGRNIFKRVSKYYLFNPQFMVWDCMYSVCTISPISSTRERLLLIFNKVFEYENCKDDYKEKIVFFEESYFADGFEIDDVSVIKRLAESYGEDDLLIKLHPRNPINRFEKLGIRTCQDQEIPWEIVALNINLDDKVLLTISSSAVVNTFVLLNCEVKMVFLYELLNLENSRFIQTKEVIERIRKLYPNVFSIPNYVNEIID